MSKSFDEYIKKNPNSLVHQSNTKYYLKSDKAFEEWEQAKKSYDKGFRRQAIIEWLLAEDGCAWKISRNSIERYFTHYDKEKKQQKDS